MKIYDERYSLEDYYNILKELQSDIKRLKVLNIISFLLISSFCISSFIILGYIFDNRHIIIPSILLTIFLIVLFGGHSIAPRDNFIGSLVSTDYKSEIRSLSASVRKTKCIIECIETGKEIGCDLKWSGEILL